MHWADMAKKSLREEAVSLQRFLMRRAHEAGVETEEVWSIINGINEHFVEEERQLMKQRMDEHLRRSGMIPNQKIYCDDDDIVAAIKKTLSLFTSSQDWGGIYRVLVDFCDFPKEKTSFIKRMAQMGVYPKDDQIEVTRNVPPIMRTEDYKGHQISYQAVQKGCPSEWPESYNNWFNCNISTSDFRNRKNIATSFLNNLIGISNSNNSY